MLDLFSRKVLGWAMATHRRTDLALAALDGALRTRRPAREPLIFNSDHGVHYTSRACRQRLHGAGIAASMGSVGDAYDNAVAERFFATLKTELLYRQTWPGHADARTAIFRYIEGWYNPRRSHSTLGYCSPDQFEQYFHHHTGGTVT